MDIDLSRTEDSVTSLAVAHSTESSATVYAGINSSEADQAGGKNEHLRSFELRYPPRRRNGADSSKFADPATEEYKGETKALGRVSLFTPSTGFKKETYQRILRLSRGLKEKNCRLATVATGLAPEGEIVVFDASKTNPGLKDVRGRINLGRGQEAGDVDLLCIQDQEYRLAYCTDYDIYLTTIDVSGQDTTLKPVLLYETTRSNLASNTARPKFRSLRFLAPSLLLVLQNKLDRQGAELLLIEISTSPVQGTVFLRKRISKTIKSATALCVAPLPVIPSSSQPIQHVIAIAGQDNSITILTLDHPISPPFISLAFRPHTTLSSVHSLQITSLAFSTVEPNEQSSKSPPQFLKLASTSIGSTVVVHTLPLISSPTNLNSQRYILRPLPRSETAQITITLLASTIVIALGAFFLQAFTEIRGGTPEYLGAKGWLSERMHSYIARPYMFADLPETLPTISISTPSVPPAIKTAAAAVSEKLSLRHLLSRQSSTHKDTPPTDIIVITPHEDGTALSLDVRDTASIVENESRVKKWEELEEQEREGWKRRLVEAGEWAVEEGEAVLKGVFFSGVAGFVGDQVGAAMAG